MSETSTEKPKAGCLYLFVCLLAFGGIKTCVDSTFKKPRESVQEEGRERDLAIGEAIEEKISQLNAKLPIKLEDGLFCESAKKGSGAQVVYKYRLTKIRKDDIDVRELKSVFGKRLLDNYRNNP